MHVLAPIGHSLRVTVPLAGPIVVSLKDSDAVQLPGPAKLKQLAKEKSNGELSPVPVAGQRIL